MNLVPFKEADNEIRIERRNVEEEMSHVNFQFANSSPEASPRPRPQTLMLKRSDSTSSSLPAYESIGTIRVGCSNQAFEPPKYEDYEKHPKMNDDIL